MDVNVIWKKINDINMSTKRVVITGVGMITSLAMSVPKSWSRILAGESGVKKITTFDTEKLPCKIASEIPEFIIDIA